MSDTSTGTLPGRFSPRVAGIVSEGATPQATILLRQAHDAVVRIGSDPVAREFKKHEKKWIAETMFHSSPVDRYLHESYARIIGLGWAVVPHILRSLERAPNDWFYALRAITGANPVQNSIAGDVDKMAKVWIDWGRSRGLIQ